MDYEKKYKKAVNKIRNLLDDGEKNGFTIVTYKTDLESIFPEIRESEDEKIRKGLIKLVKATQSDELWCEYCVPKVDALAWLEKQDEQKQEINNFDVLPGLYKCVHRMFDGTPDGRLLFEVGNVYRCLSKHDRAEFEVSYGHSVYLEDPVVCKHFIPFEKQGEVESDNDDIEVEEKGIREAFNKIEDEKQCKQKPFDYKNQGTQNSHKFNIGDIISNGNVEFRIDNIVKNCVGQDCYFLVDVESEKNGTRYLTMCVGGKTSHMGETTWLCEQVDKSFKKQGEQKPIIDGILTATNYDKMFQNCNVPKFNVGDWVVYYRNDSSREIIQVYDIRDGRYYFTDNVHFSWSVKECDEKSHLWTIQDAKNGDVLQLGGVTVIFKEYIGYENCKCYCSVYHEKFEIPIEDGEDNIYGCTNATPATKEQRDLLFQKMHEAGYEWDAEKKELKKISQRMISAEAKEAMYDKPACAWSEEDEKMLRSIMATCELAEQEHDSSPARHLLEMQLNWLKSLKQRIGG